MSLRHPSPLAQRCAAAVRAPCSTSRLSAVLAAGKEHKEAQAASIGAFGAYWSKAEKATGGRILRHNRSAPAAFQISLVEEQGYKEVAMLEFDFSDVSRDPKNVSLPHIDFTPGPHGNFQTLAPAPSSDPTVLELAAFALANADRSAYPAHITRAASALLGHA